MRITVFALDNRAGPLQPSPQPVKSVHAEDGGFTLVEMLVVLAIIALLAGLLLPALAKGKEEARCVKCLSNLRQVNVGFRVFMLDHNGQAPWHLETNEGGTYGVLSKDVWRNYQAAASELDTPKILVCPSDRATFNHVLDWSTTPRGLAYSTNRGKAISYVIGLDAYEELPATVLSGDRHLLGGASNLCKNPYTKGVPAWEFGKNPTNSSWANTIHDKQGQLALVDGSVQRTRTAALREIMLTAYKVLTNGTIRTLSGSRPDNHVQPPRF